MTAQHQLALVDLELDVFGAHARKLGRELESVAGGDEVESGAPPRSESFGGLEVERELPEEAPKIAVEKVQGIQGGVPRAGESGYGKSGVRLSARGAT